MIKKVAEIYLKDRKLDNFEKDADFIYDFLSYTTYTQIRPYCKSFYLSKNQKEFKPTISFSDITDLYYFDKLMAKELFFFLLEIERKLKSMLIDTLFERTGVCAFDKNIFDIKSKDFKELEIKINNTISSNKTTYPKDISYYLDTAFWIVIKELSFGEVRIMTSTLTQKYINSMLSKLNININIKDFKIMLKSMNYFRNNLAHDKPIYIRYDYKLNQTTSIYDVILEIHNMLDSNSRLVLKDKLSLLFKKYYSSLQKHNIKTFNLFDTFLR